MFKERANGEKIALVAAAWTAIDPYTIGMSVLLLSEALFIPFMLIGLWGLAAVWDDRKVDEGPLPAGEGLLKLARPILVGLLTAAAVLTRPSWLPFVACAEGARMVFSREKMIGKLCETTLILSSFCVLMFPWWFRTVRATGRFAPTAIWVGASLYDGLNPAATGASDMRFLDRPEFRSLGETEQDEALRHAALDFARTNPTKVVRLAMVKFGRFWSPWPNDSNLSSPLVALASSLAVLPGFAFAAFGLWESRRDARRDRLARGSGVAVSVFAHDLRQFAEISNSGNDSGVRLGGVGTFESGSRKTLIPKGGRAMSRRLFRLRPRTRRALFWTFASLFVLISATFGFAYAYVTDSDTLIALIQQEMPKYIFGGSARIDLRGCGRWWAT